jgi:hypothetical protein
MWRPGGWMYPRRTSIERPYGLIAALDSFRWSESEGGGLLVQGQARRARVQVRGGELSVTAGRLARRSTSHLPTRP